MTLALAVLAKNIKNAVACKLIKIFIKRNMERRILKFSGDIKRLQEKVIKLKGYFAGRNF